MRGVPAVRTLGFLAALAGVACGGAVSDSVSESDLTICPSGGTLEGLDVSKYEGSIDWPAVKSGGKAFAIARVSDGLHYPDAYFDSNWAAIKAQGMVRGAYQYFEPGEDPLAQADMVLQHVGTLGAGDLAPIIDVETMGGQSATAVLAAVKQWLAHVQSATGRRPILYADPSFWRGLGDPTVDADLWIANWGVSCPSVPGAWSGWKFWQYTATGTVAGINAGGVDLDRFNGSLSDLLAYAGGGNPAPPPTCPPGTTDVGGTCVSDGCNGPGAGGAAPALVLLVALAFPLRRKRRRAPQPRSIVTARRRDPPRP